MRDDISKDFKLADLTTNVSTLTTTVGNETSGLVADVAKNTTDISSINSVLTPLTATVGQHTEDISKNKADIAGLAGTITTLRSLGFVNEVDETSAYGINLTSTDLENGAVRASISVDIDTLAAAVIAKHEIPEPVASNIAVSAFGTTYTEETNVQAVLESLDSRIRAAVSGGVTSVVNGFGINVNATDANNPTVSVKTSDLVVSGSALTVNTDNKIDIVWSEL